MKECLSARHPAARDHCALFSSRFPPLIAVSFQSGVCVCLPRPQILGPGGDLFVYPAMSGGALFTPPSSACFNLATQPGRRDRRRLSSAADAPFTPRRGTWMLLIRRVTPWQTRLALQLKGAAGVAGTGGSGLHAVLGARLTQISVRRWVYMVGV